MVITKIEVMMFSPNNDDMFIEYFELQEIRKNNQRQIEKNDLNSIASWECCYSSCNLMSARPSATATIHLTTLKHTVTWGGFNKNICVVTWPPIPVRKKRNAFTNARAHTDTNTHTHTHMPLWQKTHISNAPILCPLKNNLIGFWERFDIFSLPGGSTW